MDWSILITRADNGYVASWWEEGVEHQEVFAEDEGQLDCMVNLLLFIKEYFGIYYSKHNKYNLKIEVTDEDMG